MRKYLKQGIQLSLCALAVALAACSEQETAPGKDALSKSGVTSAQKKKSDSTPTLPVLSQDQQVSGAITDLAARAGLPADAIKVKQANVVQWPNGAFGCPREGMSYTQAVVPGILVILEAGGKFYRYHGRMNGALFYCPEERAKAPGYGPGQAFM